MFEFPKRTPIANEPISLVLVSRNCGPILKEVLKSWHSVLQIRQQPYEILVVDDGSNDETVTILEEAAQADQTLRFLRHESRQGFGAALQTGIAAAQHPLLCYCTADRQYQPKQLQQLLDSIDEVDIVVGCRVWQKAPRWLRVAGMLYRGLVRVALGIPLERAPGWLGWPGMWRRWLARWTFGIFVYDPDCAFRLCRREVFDRLVIQSKGSFAHSEILAKANFLSNYVTQIPLQYQPPAPDQVPAMGTEPPSWREIRRLFSYPVFASAATTAEQPTKSL